MEEKARVRQHVPTVTREFASSRLEEQILARVYELAVPVLRRGTSQRSAQIAEPKSSRPEVLIRSIAQGA